MVMLDSNPTVSSRRQTDVLFSMRTISGPRESPVTKDGDGREGTLASNEVFLNDDRKLARCKRTEL